MGLTRITVGTISAMLCASSKVSPGENFFPPVAFSSPSSSPESFSSRTGLIRMLLAPMSLLWERISYFAPLPMASMVITAATPNMITKPVSNARVVFATIAARAMETLLDIFTLLSISKEMYRFVFRFGGFVQQDHRVFFQAFFNDHEILV